MTDAARNALADAVSLWRLMPAANAVIDAATSALVAGLDSPSLRILAGESPKSSADELRPLIEDTLDELGMAHVLAGDAVEAARAPMLRRLRAGRISPRELAAWAHRHIGHECDADWQPFVLLDDFYAEWADEGHDLAVLDRWTREEADAVLDGRPSPGHTERPMWVVPPNAARRPPQGSAAPAPSPAPHRGRRALARLLVRLRR